MRIEEVLRIISFVMLLIAIVFVIIAFLSMGPTMTLPFTVEQLHIFYKIYLSVTILLLIASSFVKDRES